MTTVTPIIQPPAQSLRDALQIAMNHAIVDPEFEHHPVAEAFGRIGHLIGHAMTQLEEPSLAAMQAGEILLREWSGTPEPERQLRDTLAGILRAQVTGEIPPTWSHE